MIQGLQKIINIIIFPLYLILYLSGLFQQGYPGLLLNFSLVFLGMWSFTRRKIPWYNFLLAAAFMAFYFLLYWTDLLEGPSRMLGLGNKWVLYGSIYSILVLVFGIIFIYKYRDSRYQFWRTLSLIIVQLGLAYVLPLLLPLFNQPEYYFSYLWPLKIEYFYPSMVFQYPLYIIIYGFAAALLLSPFLAFFLGKRFYCSWVCGCGGLAETFGDRWRHLSDKSKAAHHFEKGAIYPVLAISVLGTLIVLAAWFLKNKAGLELALLNTAAGRFQSMYAFLVSGLLAGVVGVGFYPVLGSRVWCRFFCPMAALIGLIQKLGRFQIRVKENMCISCGQCSTYCEMGIDVRAYAQQNQSFTRAACVGCGICAYVCPRGVLRLENGRLKSIRKKK